MLGQIVGSYQVLSKVSEGGMGVVYRAQHALIGKPAAVKVLLPEFSANQEIVGRFFNEARAATSIRHPGIVEIFDFGFLQSGLAYLVMEFLDGEPLSHRLRKRGVLTEAEALVILRGCTSALGAAHALGIVHRDLKPDNIFLVPDPDMPNGERPKLLDFGIAKLAGAQRQGEASARTRTGAVMGTPTYMSPEQCRGSGEVDHRSDLYSLGCILYEMVSGRPPFVADGVGEIIGSHQYLAPTSPRAIQPALSTSTEALIMQLLAKRPEDRLQSCADVGKAIGHGSMSGSQAVATAVPTRPGEATSTTPTTLSGAAAEAGTTYVAARKSRGWIAGAVAVVIVAGIVAIVAIGSGGAKHPDEPATTPAAPAAAAVHATDVAADKAAADKAAADKVAADKAAADKVAADKAAADKLAAEQHAAAEKDAADKAAADAAAQAKAADSSAPAKSTPKKPKRPRKPPVGSSSTSPPVEDDI